MQKKPQITIVYGTSSLISEHGKCLENQKYVEEELERVAPQLHRLRCFHLQNTIRYDSLADKYEQLLVAQKVYGKQLEEIFEKMRYAVTHNLKTGNIPYNASKHQIIMHDGQLAYCGKNVKLDEEE